MLNIIVCLKQTPDPEAPTSVYKVDSEGKHIILTGVPPVISPFDENALEAAIRIKTAIEGKISVISVGRNLSRAVLRKSLAVGADELILVEDDLLVDLDSHSTASMLAAAINKVGEYDLILTGREAADSNAGIVGSGIAEILGINSITIARMIEVPNDHKVRVQRIVPDGYEVLETTLPVLITVSNEVGELRSATIQEMVAAQKKPITVWNIESLGIQLDQTTKSKLISLFIPKKEMKCEFVEGQTSEEIGKNLAAKLREAELI